jgi:hypothetical protein
MGLFSSFRRLQIDFSMEYITNNKDTKHVFASLERFQRGITFCFRPYDTVKKEKNLFLAYKEIQKG